MSIIDSIFLGIVQGLTEFLPVSSSGHLAVMKYFLELKDVPILFDVILHVGTLIVVLIFFRRRIAAILVSIFHLIVGERSEEDRENLWLTVLIIFATLVTGIVGVFLSNYENTFTRNMPFVSLMFLLTAVILLVGGRRKLPEGEAKGYKKLSIGNSLLVGLAQGIGVLPGISRSGITISSSLFLGMEREKAAEFSFLISIPAILGAVILELKDIGRLIKLVSVTNLLVGFVTSFITGYLALAFLVRIVKRGRIYVFSFYLVPLGITVFVISMIIR